MYQNYDLKQKNFIKNFYAEKKSFPDRCISDNEKPSWIVQLVLALMIIFKKKSLLFLLLFLVKIINEILHEKKKIYEKNFHGFLEL